MDIEKFRAQIDAVDTEIIRLLNERCRLACEIGAFKNENNLPIYVPERERKLLERLTSDNPGPLPRESLKAIYREIMSAAIRLERKVTVAYLGPEGTYSQQAVLEKFGRSVDFQPQVSIADVFSAVEA